MLGAGRQAMVQIAAVTVTMPNIKTVYIADELDKENEKNFAGLCRENLKTQFGIDAADVAFLPAGNLAEAVAAVHGALVRGEDQGSLPVFMLHTLHDGVISLTGSIGTAAFGEFHAVRNAHPPYRIIPVLRIDEPEVIIRNADRIPLLYISNPPDLFLREIQQILHFMDAAPALRKLLLPLLHDSLLFRHLPHRCRRGRSHCL